MRFILGLTAIILVIVGALFGIGYFLLPASLTVEASREIARPRATLYALASDLRSFKDFSPWMDLDPSMTFAYSGPESGVGQTAVFESRTTALGKGALTITEAVENRLVRYRLDLGMHGVAGLRLQIDGAQAKPKVTWTFSAQCSPEPGAVLCRYVNLLARARAEENAVIALDRLERLAKSLPATDFEGLKVVRVTAAARDFAFDEGQTATEAAQMQAAESVVLGRVRAFLAASGLVQAGPAIVVTQDFDGAGRRYGFRAGYPFAGPAPLVTVGVRVGRTPEGSALKLMHEGGYDTLAESYLKLVAYMAAHRVKPSGAPWHIYPDGDPGAGGAPKRIEIHMPVAS